MLKDWKNRDAKVMIVALVCIFYAAAVIYADILFFTVIEKIFPAGILGAAAGVGAVVSAASAMLLPLGLHYWFSPGKQSYVGIGFYAVDFSMLAANAILAYEIANGGANGIMLFWQMICPATPIIAAAGWALIFMTDSSKITREAKIALQHKQHEIFGRELEIACESPEVVEAIKQGAVDAARKYAHDMIGATYSTPTHQKANDGNFLAPAPPQKTENLNGTH